MASSLAQTDPVDLGGGDIKRRITNLLWQRGGSLLLRRFDIEVDNGTVTVRGTVPSFYQRQVCLSCCQHVPGVFRVVDELKVEWLAEASEGVTSGPDSDIR